MGITTEISWTDSTVSFWWGCTAVGPGCINCYAEAWDARWGGAHWGQGVPRRKIASAPSTLLRLNRGRRRRVFISSMCDVFDLEVPLEWFAEAWGHITRCDRLELQILTKRITAVEKRLISIGAKWPQHAGLMITVVDQNEIDRDLPRLEKVKSRLDIPWVGLSVEPMLGEIEIGPYLDFVDWVICGGESGPNARPMDLTWARYLLAQCQAAGVPFFMKQDSGHKPGLQGRIPDDLWIKEFPDIKTKTER